ncbi:hypothetical protein HMPREF2800_05220 [Anaerosphaera sp. HMSC064C01]|nr:hypothetical protein HMPREF2800_05220 [Anaerosphaera sp. HMSC064C01]
MKNKINNIRKYIIQLENEYVERFGDLFPNMGLDGEEEIKIILKCLKEDKNAYELGFLHEIRMYYIKYI